MNGYYNGVDNSVYLAHYGVLGMKWGQHLMAKAKSLSPKARRQAKLDKEFAEYQAQEAARLKQSAANHKRQVARRSKMTVAQSDAELSSIKRTLDNYNGSSAKAQKKYQDLFSEIQDNIWDWYEDAPKSENGKKAQIEWDAYMEHLRSGTSTGDHIAKCNDYVLADLGYKYSPKNHQTNRNIIEEVWRWD